ncbi:DDE-domain-containing protein, partial [Ascobolus immersus RN42]
MLTVPAPSYRYLAEKYNIKKSTLWARHRKGQQSRSKAQRLRQSQRVLTISQEKEVITCIEDSAEWGFPLRYDMLRDLVSTIAKKRNPDFERLGKNWVRRFLSRYPHLRGKMSAGLDKQRKLASTRGIFEHYFDQELIRIITLFGIQPQYISNCDEKGICIGLVGREKVIVKRGEKHPFVPQDGNREMVTILETIVAQLRIASEVVIGFFEARENDDLLPGCGFATSLNGWTNKKIFRWWIEHHFDFYTRPADPSVHRLLILDGHNSHITIDALNYCRQNNIHILCLPAHTTHRLQPLDVGMFGPLQRAYGQAVEAWSRKGYSSITKAEFFKLYDYARKKAFTPENVSSAFAATGVFPLNKNVVLDKL